MIRFVTGLPGGGKGIYLIRTILDDLITSDDLICTNLPIKLGELNAYLQKHHAEEWGDQDIHDRIRFLSRDEMFFFYRIRSGGLVLKEDTDGKIKRGELDKKEHKLGRFEFLKEMEEIFGVLKDAPAEQKKGVRYRLDEIHDYFDAREWGETGRPLSWYCTKHRHLHDDVIFASQNPEQVEVRLKKLANFRIDCRNFYVERLGMFRRKGKFVAKHYYKCPENIASAVCHWEESYQLNLELANCYETAGAIQGGSKGAEAKHKMKGTLPWWAMPVGLLGGVAGVLALAWWGPEMAVPFLSKMGTSLSKAAPGNTAEVAQKAKASAAAATGSTANGAPKDEKPAEDALWVAGYMLTMDGPVVTLSDGRVLTKADRELQALEKNRALIAGQWLPLRKK